MDDKTTLNSFKSEKELESFIREIVAKATKQRIDPLTKSTAKLGERVDALASLYGEIQDDIKEIKEKTYPGDIANAIREGFTNLVKHKPTTTVEQQPTAPKQPTEQPVLQFDIFTVNWLQKNKAPAPANPNWGWTFAFTQDGGYHEETKKLVQYLERYGVYAVGDYIVKLGGKDNKLLQLNKKRS